MLLHPPAPLVTQWSLSVDYSFLMNSTLNTSRVSATQCLASFGLFHLARYTQIHVRACVIIPFLFKECTCTLILQSPLENTWLCLAFGHLNSAALMWVRWKACSKITVTVDSVVSQVLFLTELGISKGKDSDFSCGNPPGPSTDTQSSC